MEIVYEYLEQKSFQETQICFPKCIEFPFFLGIFNPQHGEGI